MKRIPDMRYVLLLLLIVAVVTCHAQLTQIPFVRQQPKGQKTEKANNNARILPLPVSLPFWDDFSYTQGYDYPRDSLWQFGHSVWVNTGMGINTPTLNVATFDGIDSTGMPYSITNAYAKGIADRLVSRPILMDRVNSADSIFIFFYYQYEGNGEAPDPGDELSLWFLDDAAVWNKVWTAEFDSASDKTKFIPVKIMIKDPQYFHDSFQFRFQNFGRLSGPFDTWNLDYIYINNGKVQSAPVSADFPDRAIATPITSPLGRFHAMPIKHFIANTDSVVFPSFIVTNQRADQGTLKPGQPLSFSSSATTVVRRKDKSITSSTVPLDVAQSIGNVLNYGEFRNVALTALPDFSSLDSQVDSLAVKFDVHLDKSDNVLKSASPDGDYDSAVYKGMNFHNNDTTRSVFSLSDYYAYDDGEAEYALTLTQPGSYVGYQYDMIYAQTDTIVALDVYFPHVGDESDQVIMLNIWNDLKSPQVDSLLWTVQRTENNTFMRVPLDHGVLVNKTFFVGWKQSSTAAIGVGFDKDSDSGSKIFYNTYGIWVQSADLHGNMMIRPVFGNMDLAVVTGIEEKHVYVYPNPNRGIFNLPASAQGVQILDVAGRKVSFMEDDMLEQKRVTLSNPAMGLYLVRFFNDGRWSTAKIMVQP